MRELPRQLSADELAPLFSGRTRLVDELAEREDPLEVAEEVALALAEEDQVAALGDAPADRRALARSSAAPSPRCWPSWRG